MALAEAERRSVVLRMWRYNPDADRPAGWHTYTLEAGRYDRLLDLLLRAKAEHDGSITFRASCGHGVCGSCAIRVNGRNRLACKELVWKLGRKITVEPLPGLRVLKDLVVDMNPIYTAYEKVLPYVATTGVLPQREQVVLPPEHADYAETAQCILCAACTTACPVYRNDAGQLGAATLVQAHRFVFDPRDHLTLERLNAINSRDGVWRCRSAYSCTDACPEAIKVTQAIRALQHKITLMALHRTIGQPHQEDCRTDDAPCSPEHTL